MNTLLKGVALFIAITCAVWVAVLWRWQATSRDMSTGDIVVYLGLLPLTLFAFALLLRWAWRGAQQRQAESAAPPAASAAPPAAADAEVARRHVTLQLLATHIACAAGASAAELSGAAKTGKPRPGLDPELRDDDGLAVFSARLPDLDLGASAPGVDAAIAATRAQRPEWAGLTPPDAVWRALAALHQPLTRSLAALAPWAARFASAPHAPAGSPPERRVRVLLGWPTAWSAFEQEVGRAFACALITEDAGAPVPASCFAISTLVGSGEDLLHHADRLLQTLAREGRDEPVLVAACHSGIGAEAVDALERTALLFSSGRRPKGRMPGEAAAALLLAGADWPAAPGADEPPQHLHRPAVLRRDKSADAPGRVSGDVLLQAMTEALAASRLGADSIQALACDADQHSGRGAEFHAAALQFAPHLDAAEDMCIVGTVTGAVDGVGALLVVAAAAERAKAIDAPCLAATLGDAFVRLALVALPGPPEPLKNAGAAPAATKA